MANHRIEQHAKIYLRLSGDGRWEIDPITFDGYPLDGLNNGPTPSESDCECDNPQECINAHNQAASITLPTATELFAMMSEYIQERAQQ